MSFTSPQNATSPSYVMVFVVDDDFVVAAVVVVVVVVVDDVDDECYSCLYENPQTRHFYDFGTFGRVPEPQSQYDLSL